MTAPLPPMGQDPSIVRGQQVRAEYTPRVQQVRSDLELDEIAAAEQVILIWDETNSELSSLYQDLQRRRQARLDALEQVVPVGPSIPDGASPADTALLHQTFRAALAEARKALPSQAGANDSGNIGPLGRPSGLVGMLDDAEKFDDDNLRRAVLTAAFENGDLALVRSWTNLNGVTALLEEFGELQQAVAGQGIAGQWNFTLFAPLPQPPEVDELPRLVNARLAARKASADLVIQQRNRSFYPNVAAPDPRHLAAPYAPGQGPAQ